MDSIDLIKLIWGNEEMKPGEHCSVYNCPIKKLHSTDGHNCQFCNKWHREFECEQNMY